MARVIVLEKSRAVFLKGREFATGRGTRVRRKIKLWLEQGKILIFTGNLEF